MKLTTRAVTTEYLVAELSTTTTNDFGGDGGGGGGLGGGVICSETIADSAETAVPRLCSKPGTILAATRMVLSSVCAAVSWSP